MTREEAIQRLKEFKSASWDGMPEEVIDVAIEALEQEPKTGHWEYGYTFADGNYCKCSECK